jgi:hypothetical protein
METTTSSGKVQEHYTKLLSGSLDPTSKVFLWSPVNFPKGWYRLESNISSSNFHSLPFYVEEGVDTSCILSSIPSSSTTSGILPPITSGSTTPENLPPTPSDPASYESSSDSHLIIFIYVDQSHFYLNF